MVATRLREREIREFISELAALDGCSDGMDDAGRVQLISALESLKAAAAAAQARISVAFAESQREAQRAAGVARDKVGAGIAESALAVSMTISGLGGCLCRWRGGRASLCIRGLYRDGSEHHCCRQ